MSAFIHDDGSFDVLLASLLRSREFEAESARSALHFVRAVREWNYKSVNYRYKNHVPEVCEPYTPKSVMPISDIALIKLIDSINYQCCEVREWEESEECRILNHLSNYLAINIIGDMAKYDAAKWEYNRDELSEAISLADLMKGV